MRFGKDIPQRLRWITRPTLWAFLSRSALLKDREGCGVQALGGPPHGGLVIQLKRRVLDLASTLLWY